MEELIGQKPVTPSWHASRMMSTQPEQFKKTKARPVLKWVGGKTQLLPELSANIPATFGKYIEPFLGGGALFFHLAPDNAVLGDTNPELINLYKCLAASADEVAEILHAMPISSEDFYRIRKLDWEFLEPTTAAARTIYLNRLCFNGLYRVNRRGEFNVPFGNYRKPSIPTGETLVNAGEALQRATLLDCDYLSLLNKYALPGDLVFLDPPYIPISKYSDFKRYNSKQFGDSDHEVLALEFNRLAEIGCHVLLTNSNHPIVHELYKGFDIRVLETRRNVNSRGSGRRGEDVLVLANITIAS